jgi:hypothetical protein
LKYGDVFTKAADAVNVGSSKYERIRSSESFRIAIRFNLNIIADDILATITTPESSNAPAKFFVMWNYSTVTIFSIEPLIRLEQRAITATL